MKKLTIDSPLVQSVAGFLSALIIGALVPRSFSFLVRRIFTRTVREVLIVAAATWLTERLAHWIVRPDPSKSNKTPTDNGSLKH